MTNSTQVNPNDVALCDDVSTVQHGATLSEIFERPLRLSKPVNALTPDMQADVTEAGQLAVSLLRKSITRAPDRLKVLHAVDGLTPDDRSGQYLETTHSVFEGIIGTSSLETQMLVKAYRAPIFTAALPVPTRNLRQANRSHGSALPAHLAGAILTDGDRVLISANLGLREHYITAQCSTTVHLISYLAANGIDAAPGNVFARVHQAMFGQEFTGITEPGLNNTLPIQDVLDQSKIRKAKVLELA